MKNKTLQITVGLILSLCIGIFPAWASGGSGHASPSDLLYPAINFCLYITLMYFLLKKPFLHALKARREGIHGALESARVATVNAENAVLEAQRKKNSLLTEIENLRRSIEADTEHEAAKVLTDAKERAERITVQSKSYAEAESRSTENALRKEVANNIVDRATEILTKKIDRGTDKGLQDRVVSDIRQII